MNQCIFNSKTFELLFFLSLTCLVNSRPHSLNNYDTNDSQKIADPNISKMLKGNPFQLLTESESYIFVQKKYDPKDVFKDPYSPPFSSIDIDFNYMFTERIEFLNCEHINSEQLEKIKEFLNSFENQKFYFNHTYNDKKNSILSKEQNGEATKYDYYNYTIVSGKCYYKLSYLGKNYTVEIVFHRDFYLGQEFYGISLQDFYGAYVRIKTFGTVDIYLFDQRDFIL